MRRTTGYRPLFTRFVFAASLLFAAPAFAHPDMAVTARFLFDFHAGQLTGMAERLAFDTLTSARLLQRVDADRDGALGPEEAERLATEIAANLQGRGFFTEITVAGRPVRLAAPSARHVTMEAGHIVLNLAFALHDPARLEGGTRLELMLRDRDLTLAFRFAPDRPLILRGDDGRCTTTIEPKPDAVYFGGLVTPEVAVLACR
jgi:ABC-type uncharacterized transport system substrate-binding protein